MSNKIKATLVDHMGSDLTVVNAARVSFAQESSEFSERDAGLIKFLSEHNHVTPFRHPQVEIRASAPIFLARQLGKHQVGFSWNEISRRYKDGDAVEVEFYVPDTIFARPANLMKEKAEPAEQWLQSLAQGAIQKAYDWALHYYKRLLEIGVAPEQARVVLPQGMITEWVWTGSLYGWACLYNQRSSEHAQHEANLFAEELNKIMLELFPICWKALTKQG